MNKEICIKKIRNITNVSETNAHNYHPPDTRRKGDGSEKKKGYGLEKKRLRLREKRRRVVEKRLLLFQKTSHPLPGEFVEKEP